MQEYYSELLNNHNYFIRKNKSGNIVQSIYINGLIHYKAGDIQTEFKKALTDPYIVKSPEDMRELIQMIKLLYGYTMRNYSEPYNKRTRSQEKKRGVNYKMGVSFTNRGRRAGNMEEWTI